LDGARPQGDGGSRPGVCDGDAGSGAGAEELKGRQRNRGDREGAKSAG